MSKKTFLMPEVFRRGNPAIHYALCEEKAGGVGYNFYLVTLHELMPEPTGEAYQGDGRDYNACGRLRISRKMYETLVLESRANHKKYAPADGPDEEKVVYVEVVERSPGGYGHYLYSADGEEWAKSRPYDNVRKAKAAAELKFQDSQIEWVEKNA